MPQELWRAVETFAKLTAIVIGDAMLDSYLQGVSTRLSQEAPVPIVSLTGRTDVPGGAANTALNLKRLGARTALVSVIGEDPEAAALLGALDRGDVCLDGMCREASRQTLSKCRVLAASHMLLRLDQGTPQPVRGDTERALLDRVGAVWKESNVVIVSDYGYGVMTPRVIEGLAALQATSPRPLLIDAKEPSNYARAGVTAAKPNSDEAFRLLCAPCPADPRTRADVIASHQDELLRITNAEIVAVTLDEDGAVILERGQPPYRTSSKPAPHVRAVGAGDTFLAAFALALAAGGSTRAAAETAAAAAGVVVGRNGTAACSGPELQAALLANAKHVTSHGAVAARVEQYRRQGKKIVFTNGCFDILHRGHITYLNEAKAMGDVLIVGVNGDASVARLKGAGRPINPLEDRLQVLAALSCVDHVVCFEEDTPATLLIHVRPDVYVKGGDYSREMLPEADLVESLGGSVRILPYVDHRSTTGLIERIRTQPAAGAVA